LGNPLEQKDPASGEGSPQGPDAPSACTGSETGFEGIQPKAVSAELRLRALYLASPAVVNSYELRGNHSVTFVSENVQAHWGYAPAEILENPRFWIEHVHPEDRSRALEDLSGLFEHDQVVTSYRVLHKDGTYRWVRDERKLVRDAMGQPLEVIGFWLDVSDQKRTEEAIQEQLHFLQTLIDTIPSPVFYKDTEGRYLGCNSAFEEFIGFSKEAIVGKTVYDLAPTELADKYREMDTELLRTGGIQRYDALVRHADESMREVVLNRATFSAGDQAVAGLVGVMTDITVRKLAEEALRVSEDNYRTLVENANVGVFVMQDGMYKFANRKALAMTGYPLEELMAMPFTQVVHPDDREMVLENHLKRLRGEDVPQVYPFRIVDKAGNTRWLEINAVSFNREGKPATLNFLSDITERRHSEERIFRQSALLGAINKVFLESLLCESREEVAAKCLAVAEELTCSKFGFVGELNAKGRLDTLAMSDPGWEACEIPRVQAEKAIQNIVPRGIWGEVLKTGKALISNAPASHPASIGVPEGHPEIKCFLGAPLLSGVATIGVIALANKESGYTVEDQEAMESLSVAFVEALLRKRAEKDLRRHRDQLEVLVGQRTLELRVVNEELCRGIEQRKEVEEKVRKLNEELEDRVKARTRELEEAYEKLKDLDRMKDSFLSSVSHELRTPLTSIRSFSEILLHYDDVDPENFKEFMGIINSESERLTRLINDLLDLSRIEAGGMVWHDGLFNLGEVIQDTGRAQGQILEEKSLRLSLDIPPSLPCVFADRDRIQQVLTNLLNNAVKFSWTGGEIGIRVEAFPGKRSGDPEEWIKVSLSDQGAGIEEKDLKIIFDRFRQGSCDTMSNKPKGTGLGLPICKEIISHYGGAIRVESEQGKGSTFSFTLPVRPREVQPEKDESGAEKAGLSPAGAAIESSEPGNPAGEVRIC